jgi:signal transduction histidine kinase
MLCVIKEHAAVQADSALFGMSLEEFERDLLDLADSIEKGSERIKTIVDELKDFSCLGEQTETLSGNPAQTIAQAVRICRVQLKSKVRNLYINIPKGLPNAYFEVKGLEQTIVNILINAAQAADKQDSWVRLKAMIVDNGKRYFVIEISDNGCGMEANNLKKIFDPFYTTKPSGQGTGLGLYVCHNLIEKMGGHMDVESSLGKGSTFKIMLRCE